MKKIKGVGEEKEDKAKGKGKRTCAEDQEEENGKMGNMTREKKDITGTTRCIPAKLPH